jgi:hypothetical protein
LDPQDFQPVDPSAVGASTTDRRRRAGDRRKRPRVGFAEDFRRFFVRGAAALLPTLIPLVT